MVHQTYTLYQVVPKRSVCTCQTCQIKLVGVSHCFAWQVTHPTRLRQSMSALVGDPDPYPWVFQFQNAIIGSVWVPATSQKLVGVGHCSICQSKIFLAHRQCSIRPENSINHGSTLSKDLAVSG